MPRSSARLARTILVTGLPSTTDERALTFHIAAAAPVEQVTIRRGGLYDRTAGGLAEAVLKDTADVDLVQNGMRPSVRVALMGANSGFVAAETNARNRPNRSR
jgi:hypothetical protein